ncbi:hypothetical protein llap_9657 [Limosa lapponica baueri]|uniref:Uncharacterized protein n=1 Tax=Limosa lapponica baueri TaxID=1758121 RepID=A0A2I0U1X8_LIMLA|nr:hypothetical protein llap_9657 [Limosa lapponica baueri]
MGKKRKTWKDSDHLVKLLLSMGISWCLEGHRQACGQDTGSAVEYHTGKDKCGFQSSFIDAAVNPNAGKINVRLEDCDRTEREKTQDMERPRLPISIAVLVAPFQHDYKSIAHHWNDLVV